MVDTNYKFKKEYLSVDFIGSPSIFGSISVNIHNLTDIFAIMPIRIRNEIDAACPEGYELSDGKITFSSFDTENFEFSVFYVETKATHKARIDKETLIEAERIKKRQEKQLSEEQEKEEKFKKQLDGMKRYLSKYGYEIVKK